MSNVPTVRRNQGGRLTSRRQHPLERLQHDFDTLLSGLWSGWLSPADDEVATMRLADFEAFENDKEITIRAELPGFEEDEIDVQIDDGVLTLKAEKQQRGQGMEAYRSFFRSITLPRGVEPEKAEATYRNGILELRIPKSQQAQAKRIQVQRQNGAGHDQSQRNGNQGQSTNGGAAQQSEQAQGQQPSSGQSQAATAQSQNG